MSDLPLIYLEPTKDKREIIKILSDPRIYRECYGIPYYPKARVHIGFQNYYIKYKQHILGLFQLDKFVSHAVIFHGCVLPKFRKPNLLVAIADACKDNLRKYSEFNKIVTTVPSNANHVLKFLNKVDFKEEARIKDCFQYNSEIADCILMTFNLRE